MKLTKIELPYEVVTGFAKLSEAIGNPTEVESEHDHVETEILERGAARIAELEKALREIVRTAAVIHGDVCGGNMHPVAAQYLVSARAVEAARALMVSVTK